MSEPTLHDIMGGRVEGVARTLVPGGYGQMHFRIRLTDGRLVELSTWKVVEVIYQRS